VKIGTAGILKFKPIHQTTDRTMAQRVGRQALTAEGQVRSQTTSGAIRSGRSDNLTGFHLSTSDISVNTIRPLLHAPCRPFIRHYIILETESFGTKTLLSLVISHGVTSQKAVA
jgi:hypothetical protein